VVEDYAMMPNQVMKRWSIGACVMVQGDRIIVGTIRFKGFHSIKFPNLMNKINLITYPSFDYLELPYHLLNHSVEPYLYESFDLCFWCKEFVLDWI
jgi:hypothetical protein